MAKAIPRIIVDLVRITRPKQHVPRGSNNAVSDRTCLSIGGRPPRSALVDRPSRDEQSNGAVRYDISTMTCTSMERFEMSHTYLSASIYSRVCYPHPEGAKHCDVSHITPRFTRVPDAQVTSCQHTIRRTALVIAGRI